MGWKSLKRRTCASSITVCVPEVFPNIAKYFPDSSPDRSCLPVTVENIASYGWTECRPEGVRRKGYSMALRLPHSRTCFVCGDSNASGLKVRFWTDGDKVWTTVRVGEPHTGYRGISHGGVLAALLDETMGWAPAVHTGRFCMAVELHIEYRKSVPIGEELTVTGYVKDVSRRIWEGTGDIRGADGTVYVRGSGRFMPMSEAATDEVIAMLVFDEGTIPREQIVAARSRAAARSARASGHRGAEPIRAEGEGT